MADLPRAVDKIGAHLGLTPKAHEIPPFEEIRKAAPTIFRKAETSGNGGMTEAQEDMFWNRHGAVMGMFGYERQ